MTARVTLIPAFHARQEGEGFVVYVPDSGTYLYADATTHDALTALRSQDFEEVNAMLAARLRYTTEETELLLYAIMEVLSGRRSSVSADGGGGPFLRPLSDVIGADAERCETFGMPL